MNLTAIFELFTKENITFILAVIGSFGTITGWIYHFIRTRKNITLNIAGHQWNEMGVFVYFQMTNNSLQTISINDISIFVGSYECHCSAIPVRVLEVIRRVGKEITNHKEYYSVELPVTLAPLCGTSGYLNFSFDSEIQGPAPTELNFVIRTNRGRAIKRKLPLGNHIY